MHRGMYPLITLLGRYSEWTMILVVRPQSAEENEVSRSNSSVPGGKNSGWLFATTNRILVLLQEGAFSSRSFREAFSRWFSGVT